LATQVDLVRAAQGLPTTIIKSILASNLPVIRVLGASGNRVSAMTNAPENEGQKINRPGPLTFLSSLALIKPILSFLICFVWMFVVVFMLFGDGSSDAPNNPSFWIGSKWEMGSATAGETFLEGCGQFMAGFGAMVVATALIEESDRTSGLIWVALWVMAEAVLIAAFPEVRRIFGYTYIVAQLCAVGAAFYAISYYASRKPKRPSDSMPFPDNNTNLAKLAYKVKAIRIDIAAAEKDAGSQPSYDESLAIQSLYDQLAKVESQWQVRAEKAYGDDWPLKMP
jgi:hypothetical protein